MTGFYSCHKIDEKFEEFIWFWGTLSQYYNVETFVWILSHVSRSITWSLFTLKASYLVNDQSRHDLSCGGVSLSIG